MLFTYISLLILYLVIFLLPFNISIIELPTFDFHPVTGVFGWLAKENVLFVVLVLAIGIRLLGQMAITQSFYFFSSIIVANIYMLGPICC